MPSPLSRRSSGEALLSWRRIEAMNEPGKYQDGGGLMLVVDQNGNKRWVQRVTINGKRVSRGLGPYRRNTMSDVRDRSRQIREAAREGRDLVAEAAGPTPRQRVETFRDAFEIYWPDKSKHLRNAKNRQQWQNTLGGYVLPHIGDRPVADVTPTEIVDILRPLWHEKPETAGRVRQRMHAVFEAAIVREVRTRANPCTGVATVLGPLKRSVVHRPALPWQDVPRFVSELRASSATPLMRLAFEFLILTAARSEEVRLATWSEISEDEALWTIPAQRMKAGAQHRVPLAQAALSILMHARRLSPDSDLVFPAPRGGAFSDSTFSKYCRTAGENCVPHGFRTSFRTWAAETGVPELVAEAALAHVDANQVRSAYRRTDHLEERRIIMQSWADHVLVK